MTVDSHCRVARFLNTRSMVAIGILSYSLYLAQPFSNIQRYDGWPLSWWWNVPCVFTYALLSYFLIEQPFLRLKDRLTRPPMRRAIPTSSVRTQQNGGPRPETAGSHRPATEPVCELGN